MLKWPFPFFFFFSSLCSLSMSRFLLTNVFLLESKNIPGSRFLGCFRKNTLETHFLFQYQTKVMAYSLLSLPVLRVGPVLLFMHHIKMCIRRRNLIAGSLPSDFRRLDRCMIQHQFGSRAVLRLDELCPRPLASEHLRGGMCGYWLNWIREVIFRKSTGS